MKYRNYCAALALAFAAACGGADSSGEKDEPEGVSSGGGGKASEASASDLAETTDSKKKNAYFGDLHIHTKNSFDAYIFGTRSTPDDAYRFAKGETIKHPAGYDIQLVGPALDFMAVTDHGEYLGIVPAMDNPEHPIGQTEIAQAVFGENATDPVTAFGQIGISFVTGNPIDEINDVDYMTSIWAETIATADRHYEPGEFTTFAGYEFTAMTVIDAELVAAANLHRNVIFKDAAPTQLFSTLNSTNPEDLWDWMDTQRADGRDVLSIPHNSNASNGEMFAMETYEGAPLTEDYAVQRLRNEPIIEITQLKGTSETHPEFSPNDEWSNFEQYEVFIGSQVARTNNLGDFARPSLARGIALSEEIGANPFEFGFIGSSDTHVSAGSFSEQQHHGKFGNDGVPAARQSIPAEGKSWAETPQGNGRAVTAAQFGASGLAGVWAEENTREAIFEAMQRRETFGTSGPRIRIHLKALSTESDDQYAGQTLAQLEDAAWTAMGGELASKVSPHFHARAMRELNSAPLQRLQMIKVWHENGEPKETLVDIACSQGQPVDGRCPDNGASVSTTTCLRTGRGASQLETIWRDPDYDPSLNAAYYVRVLENPKCRWSTWDAVRNGTPPNPNMEAVIQDRAWTSPIWVKAEK